MGVAKLTINPFVISAAVPDTNRKKRVNRRPLQTIAHRAASLTSHQVPPAMLSSSPGRQADANMQGFSSEILESKKKTTIKKRKETLDKYEMPAHWRPIHPSERFGKLRQAAFSLFCLTAHGHFDLEDFWAVIRLEQEEGDESGWTEELRKLIERMNGMLVVVRSFSALT